MNFKKILIVIISLLAYGVSWAGGIQDQHKRYLARINAGGGGVTCSGDMSDGDNESFEKGAGEFCTTDWTEVDVDGVVDTYSTGFAHTGTHSLKVTCDGDSANEPDNRVYADTGSEDADLYERFYWTPPTLASGSYLRFHSVGNDDNELLTGCYFLQWFNNSGTYQFILRNSAGSPGEHFELTPGSKYRVEIHATQSGTCTMKVFDSSDNPVLTSNGGADYDLTHSGLNIGMRYFIFRDFNSGTTEAIYYIDDYVIDLDGSDYIGPQL